MRSSKCNIIQYNDQETLSHCVAWSWEQAIVMCLHHGKLFGFHLVNIGVL